MATHALTSSFTRFFKRLNPTPSFQRIASSQHRNIRRLIERQSGPAGALSPSCYLQGSYTQDTAIYTINDIDIVAVCELPSSGWTRDHIFKAIADSIAISPTYRRKVRYGPTSMVIHVDLSIDVEILPVVSKGDKAIEPFRLYRPQEGVWEDGYAREHQTRLTHKNVLGTSGNFKPMIKVLKHLRSHWGLDDVVSFHLECLLYQVPSHTFAGGAADYIPRVLTAITQVPASAWDTTALSTPCGDRDIFSTTEWGRASWMQFHSQSMQWAVIAQAARDTRRIRDAVTLWQDLLGKPYFSPLLLPSTPPAFPRS